VIVENLKAFLSAPRNDDRLHFSQHLQHDRHAVLYHAYGYPSTVPAWGRMFPLIQGTGVHETIHHAMKSLYPKYKPEYEIIAEHSKLKYRWGGTADAYVEIDDTMWLLDYKTISGPGMMFLGDYPKPDHVWQVSAYYHFGPTQNVKTAVLYLPSTSDYKNRWEEPRFLEFKPHAKTAVLTRMREVETSIENWKRSGILPEGPSGKWQWKKKGRSQTWSLIYKPHYTTMFCPWGGLYDDPCGCSMEETITAGTFKDGDLKIDKKYAIIIDEIGLPNEDDAETP